MYPKSSPSLLKMVFSPRARMYGMYVRYLPKDGLAISVPSEHRGQPLAIFSRRRDLRVQPHRDIRQVG